MLTRLLRHLIAPLLEREYQRGVNDTLSSVGRLSPHVRQFRTGPGGRLIPYADTRPMRRPEESTP